jgi:ParB family chromosome partitioning protein
VSEKRRGLGRGLGALIPTGADGQRPKGDRPVDVFFPGPPASQTATAVVDAPANGEDVAAEAAGVLDAAGAEDQARTAGTATTDGGAAATATRETDTTTSQPTTGQAGAGQGAGQDGAGSAAAGNDGGTPAAGQGPADVDTAVHGAPHDDGPGADGRETADEGGLVPVPGARFAELPVESIRPNPRQPRTVFDEEALDELVGSIREVGVLQPVVVRAVGDGYELIMGERRWRATQAAGLTTIPAIIRETDDGDLLRDALLENLHRSQLNPLEEAAAYQQLLDDFGCTHDELATRIQRSRPQISNTLRLLKLPPLVQRRVAAGVLSAGHARALLGLNDAAAAERLAQRIVAEGLSVRMVEEIVALGGDEAKPVRRAAPRAGERNAALDDLASRLSDRFDTRVKVSLGKTRGRLTVEFASVQDLNRILSSLAPEDPGLLRG